MQKMTIEQFKECSNIEIIEKIIQLNNGYVTTKMVTDLGIHRMYLNIMKKKGMIERVGKGVYLDPKRIEDSYYILSLENPNVIYSHMTALYFHDLSIKAPDGNYDISIPEKYHNPNIKKYNLFFIADKHYNLGITEVETPMGNKVKAYDIERCICDIIKYRKRMDIDHVKYSVRQYTKRKDKNPVKLSKYAEALGVKDKVMEFISMLYE